MTLVINTNIGSINAQRHLALSTSALDKTREKLASGFRINRASDDAAGLQLSENLRAQIRGSKKALDNVQDAINVLNIVEGVYAQMTENFQRMRELAVQAANDTYEDSDPTTFWSPARSAMQMEIDALYAENDRLANSTQFNGINLLDGSIDGIATFFRIQVGPNGTPNDVLDITSLFEDARMQLGFGLGPGSVNG